MRELLSAGLHRFRKSAVFWVTLAITLVLGLIAGAVTESSASLQIIYFVGLFLVIVIQISLMIGIEFGNGVVRNKLIAGHGKSAVFFSELILSLISATLLFVVFYGAFALFNANAQWLKHVNARVMATVIVVLWLLHLTLAAICTAICFFIPYYAAVAAVLNVVLVLVMTFVCDDLHLRFNEPEFFYTRYYDENGELGPEIAEPNPKSIPRDSTEYALLHTAYYIMPFGQLIDCATAVYSDQLPDDLKTAPQYSVIAMGAFTVAGVISFRKKNLK